MSVYLYDTIDITKIRFSSKPYKREIMDNDRLKSVYFIDINYYKNPLYIQLPKLSIIKLDNFKILIKISDYVYQRFIKVIEECVIDKVYNNSERWFNGKRFTMNKIMNGLVTPVHYRNKEYILEIIYDKDTTFYNQYKSYINVDNINLPIDGVCIIKLDNLQFVENKFTYNIFLEQAKIFENKRLKEYSILEKSISDKFDKNKTEKSEHSFSDINESSSSSINSVLEDEYYLEKK